MIFIKHFGPFCFVWFNNWQGYYPLHEFGFM